MCGAACPCPTFLLTTLLQLLQSSTTASTVCVLRLLPGETVERLGPRLGRKVLERRTHGGKQWRGFKSAIPPHSRAPAPESDDYERRVCDCRIRGTDTTTATATFLLLCPFTPRGRGTLGVCSAGQNRGTAAAAASQGVSSGSMEGERWGRPRTRSCLRPEERIRQKDRERQAAKSGAGRRSIRAVTAAVGCRVSDVRPTSPLSALAISRR